MFVKYIIVMVALCCFFQNSRGQKLIRYCQTNSPYFSNCYILKKSSQNVHRGAFKWVMTSDDSQEWRGEGTYIESSKAIKFSRLVCIHKLYNFKRDTVLKCDTSIIPTSSLYKKGKYLLDYSRDPNSKKVDTVFFKRE